MAGGLSLPALRGHSLLAGAVRPDAMSAVWSPDLGDGWYDLPGHAQAFGGLVPGHVLAGEPEERSQRPGPAEGAGIGQLQNRVDMVAQAAARDGTTGA